jgi:hypothetical protein
MARNRDAKRPAKAKPPDPTRIARSHPELQSLVKSRHRVILVQPNTADRGQPEGAEQAIVGLYDYERNRSVIALVDTQENKVVALADSVAHFQLSEEERKEAETLAAEDPGVDAFLNGRSINPLTRLYFPPGAAFQGAPHRYAVVFLRPDSSERRYAVVDLSERRVVEVLTRRDFTGR